MMTTLTSKLLAALLISSGLFISGYFIGKSDERTDNQAKTAASLQRLIAQQAALAKQDNEVLATHEVTNDKIRIIYRTITQKVNDYALTHHADACVLDADGLRLWHAANAGDTAPATSQSDYTLPTTATTKLGAANGAVSQPRRSSADVLPMPRKLLDAGQVGQ